MHSQACNNTSVFHFLVVVEISSNSGSSGKSMAVHLSIFTSVEQGRSAILNDIECLQIRNFIKNIHLSGFCAKC